MKYKVVSSENSYLLWKVGIFNFNRYTQTNALDYVINYKI